MVIGKRASEHEKTPAGADAFAGVISPEPVKAVSGFWGRQTPLPLSRVTASLWNFNVKVAAINVSIVLHREMAWIHIVTWK